MFNAYLRMHAVFVLSTTLACSAITNAAAPIPDPAVDVPLAETKGEQTAIIAGGCFRGVEAVFEHVKGVTGVISGYSGGAADTANYEMVSTGETGHAGSGQKVMLLKHSASPPDYSGK